MHVFVLWRSGTSNNIVRCVVTGEHTHLRNAFLKTFAVLKCTHSQSTLALHKPTLTAPRTAEMNDASVWNYHSDDVSTLGAHCLLLLFTGLFILRLILVTAVRLHVKVNPPQHCSTLLKGKPLGIHLTPRSRSLRLRGLLLLLSLIEYT